MYMPEAEEPDLTKSSATTVASSISSSEIGTVIGGKKKQEEETKETKEEEEAEHGGGRIKWVNIIFLPFSDWWQIIIMISVGTKCVMGPLSAIYPSLQCPQEKLETLMDYYIFFYMYLVDMFYIIDTFIYLLHRQVTDEAMKREFLPKPAGLIMLDIFALIPLDTFFSEDLCGIVDVWPNIICFNELLIIYRIGHYFSLNVTHSYFKLIIGYVIIFAIVMNALTCLFLLLTARGLCRMCHKRLYDWRAYMQDMIKSKGEFEKYMFAANYVSSIFIHFISGEYKPSTYMEFLVADALALLGFIFIIFFLVPKMYCEVDFRLRKFYKFQHSVKYFLAEIRSNRMKNYYGMKQYYTMIWVKNSGITRMPNVLKQLPKSFQTDIRLDLAWTVFHHSPNLRNTSMMFKRWLCDHVELKHILPGDKLFDGSSNLYYIKDGIVQIFSSDDNTVATLSVTNGTLFGDTSFYAPPTRNAKVCCLTYCEVLTISRENLLKALYKFPNDRKYIMKLTKDRFKHARDLYECKLKLKLDDRNEEEGIAWLKFRWWEIADAISSWKTSKARSKKSCTIPPESSTHHCSKYIGQLVLCKDAKLRTSSLFVKLKFPWTLAPDSALSNIWQKIVFVSVFLAAVLVPPSLARIVNGTEVAWFKAFSVVIGIVYVMDVIYHLITPREEKDFLETSMLGLIFNRCKDVRFLMDVLSTPFLDIILTVLHVKKYEYLAQFNRLIKSYLLFTSRVSKDWSFNHLRHMYFKSALLVIFFMYVSSHFMYVWTVIAPYITADFYFTSLCNYDSETAKECWAHLIKQGIMSIFIDWISTLLIYSRGIHVIKCTIYDMTVSSIIMTFFVIFFAYVKVKHIAALCLKNQVLVEFQYTVTKVETFYKKSKAHPSLLQRLHKYVQVHWKYNKGTHFLYSKEIRNQPDNVYWSVYGNFIERIFKKSDIFKNADPAFIKCLVPKARLLIIPKDETVQTFGIINESLNFLVRGVLICEYQDDNNVTQKNIIYDSCVTGTSSVFFKQTTMKTYTAATDIEILSISRMELLKTLHRFPEEREYFQNCVAEIKPLIEKAYVEKLLQHKEYEKNLRDRIFLKKTSVETIDKIFEETSDFTKKKKWWYSIAKLWSSVGNIAWIKDFRTNPESRFVQIWFIIRASVVFLTFLNLTIGGAQLLIFWSYIEYIVKLSEVIVISDMILKFFIPYYDERGIVVTSIRKCAQHYLTRGFVVDILSFLLQFPRLLTHFFGKPSEKERNIIRTLGESGYLYLLFGIFDYYSNSSNTRNRFLIIVKWHAIIFIVMMIASRLYIYECCVVPRGQRYENTRLILRNETCWMPVYLNLDPNRDNYISHFEHQLICAQSLSLVQNGFFNNFQGQNHFDVHRTTHTLVFCILSCIFCYQMIQCQASIILHSRGDDVIHQDIGQLEEFLKSERIDKNLISRASNYYNYWWKRTMGTKHQIFEDKISTVLSQDFFYYFYKRTLKATDTLLDSGDAIIRHIAGLVDIAFYLPKEEIVREMELCDQVYIIHRGKVIIKQQGKKLATLAKGCIFGMLEGKSSRPMNITAEATEHVDLLFISSENFQEIIPNSVRQKIAVTPTSKNNFMALKKVLRENPYNTVEYLMGGMKAIKLPKMKNAVTVENSGCFHYWLLWCWVVAPVISSALVLLYVNAPSGHSMVFKIILRILDVSHLIYLITELYTVKLQVVNNICTYQYVGWKKFLDWWLYIDLASIILPLNGIIQINDYHIWELELARLFRIYNVFFYHKHFCSKIGLQSQTSSLILKLTLILLLIHTLTCGWITVACRFMDGFHHSNFYYPPNYLDHVSPEEWLIPKVRNEGCARASRSYNITGYKRRTKNFFVPRYFYMDYLVALTYIITLLTHTNLDCVMPMTIKAIYYKIFATQVLYLLELWITTSAISAAHAKFRPMYTFDFKVLKLLDYMQCNGIGSFLLNSVKSYTKTLWMRHQGSQLPEITYQLPMCLREDIFESLYGYHLQTPRLFSFLPTHFLRQMAVRLKRNFVFPGKFIVQEGDIHSCLYFIHEGEVEKWYTDQNGENRMASVLCTNGYFGILPGLFPNIPYTFSYYSRTIVDVVSLELSDWQDLLDGYPEYKNKLYQLAGKMKKDRNKQ